MSKWGLASIVWFKPGVPSSSTQPPPCICNSYSNQLFSFPDKCILSHLYQNPKSISRFPNHTHARTHSQKQAGTRTRLHQCAHVLPSTIVSKMDSNILLLISGPTSARIRTFRCNWSGYLVFRPTPEWFESGSPTVVTTDDGAWDSNQGQ